ncbi:2-oxoacid:acceptor oxidoreductase subunit alpha [Gammaproteobacteria bacterium]|nr:2-oxoacid:acceptor oxidoreductase subunit alpha [Gammaproteobacteria bacterium]
MQSLSAAPASITIALIGSGGSGVMTAGSLLLDAAGHANWYAYMTRSSGPQIRGGEAAAMIRISNTPVESHDNRFDILVAIDWRNAERFAAEIPLDSDSLIVADPEGGAIPEKIAAMGARNYDLPMKALCKGIVGGRPNMVALGAIAALTGLPEQSLLDILGKALGRKGEAAITASTEAIRAGIASCGDLPSRSLPRSTDTPATERWSITGNEAVGLGALRGGVRFVAAYPITPATEVLEWLAPALDKVGGVLVQAEDELSSINQIIGASFGGVPALTATSGPGLALMMESIGLAVAAEIPIVVVNVMRGGPSTGIPTKSEQTDLNIALYGLHGDAPHLVVAPTSVADCLFTTQWGVQLAEALQTPAIVLSDQSLGQTRAVLERPADLALLEHRNAATHMDPDYKRYAVTASGISPMAIPGTPGGQYTADGLEHNELGTPSSQAEDHRIQLDKRYRKLHEFNYGDHWADIEGTGKIAVITWGSSCGPVREALAQRRDGGRNIRLVAVRLLSPEQPDKLQAALQGVERVLVVEQSHRGQFYKYLRAHYDLPGEIRAFFRPGPLPIRPREVHEQLAEWN